MGTNIESFAPDESAGNVLPSGDAARRRTEGDDSRLAVDQGPSSDRAIATALP